MKHMCGSPYWTTLADQARDRLAGEGYVREEEDLNPVPIAHGQDCFVRVMLLI